MRIPAWAWAVAAALFLFAVLFFFQTKDPMIMIFGVFSAGMLLLVTFVASLLRGGASIGAIRVRCVACGALNLEDAKFCSQCGRAI